MEIKLHTFITSTLDGDELSALTSSCFIYRKKVMAPVVNASGAL
jgi:hypothetical protein